MGFHGTCTDDELRGDLWIGHACGHQAENLTFTGRQDLVLSYFRDCLCCSAELMVEIGCDGVRGECFPGFPMYSIRITIQHRFQLGLKTLEQWPVTNPVQGGISRSADPGEQFDGCFGICG